MAKPYYAEYVNHMLRLYFRYDANKTGFKFDKPIDKTNYFLVDKVVDKIEHDELEILEEVYSQRGPQLEDVIKTLASQKNVAPREIWSVITKVTNLIARERGLI